MNGFLIFDQRSNGMKIAFFLAFGLILAMPTTWAQRQLIDRVVAVVNDEAITQSEIDGLLRPIYMEYKQRFTGDRLMREITEARKKLLHQLIEDKLVFQEAESLGVTVEPSEIEGRLESFRAQFPTEAALEDAMRAEGLTYKSLEERIRRQTMIRKLHSSEVRSRIVISPTELQDYYKNHPEEFKTEDQIKTRSLTIKKSDNARRKGTLDESAKKRIDELRVRVVKGEDFGALAKDFSEDTRAKEGGLTGWIKEGDMIPVIDEVIFGLEQGEVSEVIETPMGYHIFRVEEVAKGTTYSFEQMRDQIYDRIFGQKADERFQEWIKDLKKDAYISIR